MAIRRQTCVSGKGSGSWGADPEGAGGLLDWKIRQKGRLRAIGIEHKGARRGSER